MRLSLALLLICLASPLAARVWQPADDAALASALDQARAGDEIVLGAGRWRGPLLIETPLTLRGEAGAVVDGRGQGHVIAVDAPDVRITGLAVTGSGSDLDKMDSGIFLTKRATGARVDGNVLTDNLHGIRIQGARDSLVADNRIEGRRGRQSELGNGVSVWNAPGAVVEGNKITLGRDGIFVSVSKKNVFRGNDIHGTRFAIHYMNTADSTIEGNRSRDNTMGYAIMFSNRLKIIGNRSDNDRDYGLLLNSANHSVIEGNVVTGHPAAEERWRDSGQSAEAGVPAADPAAGGSRIAPEKCVFIYDTNKNSFIGNRFEGCAIGVHFTAGAEGNRMSRNDFIGNRIQVKYVGTRYLEWSLDGIGNYWSDNAAFDLDGDGLADSPYRPNDMVDKVMWTAPQARLLLTSPAVQILRFAQSRFPALLPGGVTDSHALMRPNSERPL
ncbi:nitrous oxide reductase family maturation protein NosD [Paracoccus aminovorans]|uniref:nitrous oxide reductase family maturation protein NosD n=1 Tax=Paracoccus aminovorans TaxID=34004 RepID=UPI000782B0A2|nr:nitrous oxide reductase family maturation protein NosD [Paracoccus aminovorans]MDQ7774819.1 nitrous oxide reductase family maturation protein NosD [Paracoccus aminovorans]